MKTLKILVAIFSLFALIACRSNLTDEENQKKKEDSLMEIERNNALNNADKLLQAQDSIDALNDTVVPEKK
jgi:hypothetical protein